MEADDWTKRPYPWGIHRKWRVCPLAISNCSLWLCNLVGMYAWDSHPVFCQYGDREMDLGNRRVFGDQLLPSLKTLGMGVSPHDCCSVGMARLGYWCSESPFLYDRGESRCVRYSGTHCRWHSNICRPCSIQHRGKVAGGDGGYHDRPLYCVFSHHLQDGCRWCNGSRNLKGRAYSRGDQSPLTPGCYCLRRGRWSS